MFFGALSFEVCKTVRKGRKYIGTFQVLRTSSRKQPTQKTYIFLNVPEH
jgi:hypothetical protein